MVAKVSFTCAVTAALILAACSAAKEQAAKAGSLFKLEDSRAEPVLSLRVFKFRRAKFRVPGPGLAANLSCFTVGGRAAASVASLRAPAGALSMTTAP